MQSGHLKQDGAKTHTHKPSLSLTVHLLTEQGTPLTLHLAAIPRLPAGHPEPIVEFRYTGGTLCSSYYLSTFLEVSSGLCLQGGTYSRQDIDANTVSLCKQQCVAWMQECGLTLQQP